MLCAFAGEFGFSLRGAQMSDLWNRRKVLRFEADSVDESVLRPKALESLTLFCSGGRLGEMNS